MRFPPMANLGLALFSECLDPGAANAARKDDVGPVSYPILDLHLARHPLHKPDPHLTPRIAIPRFLVARLVS